ncbi:uncharacterized protein [Henckelia pumila]|uniref:uncharacterized protein n=1 Tax=Henckelia pumila TaxID=405737 RepID=UPI003C6E4D34
MGCVSSKQIKKEAEEQNLDAKLEDDTKHLVSLTSSTYGVLNLEAETQQKKKQESQQQKKKVQKCRKLDAKTSPPREEPAEIINTWELMKGLEEEVLPVCVQAMISPKSSLLLRGFLDIDRISPLKFLNQMGSPRKLKRFAGKENKGRVIHGVGSLENSPKMVLKECNKSMDNCLRPSPNGEVISAKRSLGKVFCPKVVASVKKNVSEEEQDIKKIISTSSTPTSRMATNYSQDSDTLFDMYGEKCPPGGENAVVLYTTTLRSIRKTFEDCNATRSIIESHHVRMFERDVSLHSPFKEELRALMGTKDVKLPLVFVKGRMIGGVDEMVRLDEEGKLDILLHGIPRETVRCRGCAGIRFIMCKDCGGSSKILGEDGKKSLKCKECNENGLILCSLCC